jgi:hypothetical protein
MPRPCLSGDDDLVAAITTLRITLHKTARRLIPRFCHCALRPAPHMVMWARSLSKSWSKIGDVPKSPVPRLAADSQRSVRIVEKIPKTKDEIHG